MHVSNGVNRTDLARTSMEPMHGSILKRLLFQGRKHSHSMAARRPASLKQARMQSLLLDATVLNPATQFCTDPADCMRNDEYFMEVRSSFSWELPSLERTHTNARIHTRTHTHNCVRLHTCMSDSSSICNMLYVGSQNAKFHLFDHRKHP